MSPHYRRLLLASTVLGCAACEDPYVPPPPGVLNVLFVGSSATYWHEMPFVVEALSRELAETRRLEPTVVAYGGHSLPAHWERPEARAAIAAGGWQLVVLEPWYGTDSLRRQEDADALRRFGAEVSKVGARPVLYMRTPHESAAADEFAAARSWHEQLAREIGAVIVPVSDAWRAAHGRQPALVLREEDGHANIAGTYLTALTFYAVLYGRSPLAAPARFDVWSSGLGRVELPPAVAELLREAAAEVTRAYTRPAWSGVP